ncbi:hypothetical protein [Sinisalibacter lacisalsi]|uniref:Uncharacterized protein n=1 Tax=Sinisalibacter lacisalsi TaxID=1526570 RepID=A0ABQ1QLZ9_9RHOB|nr:hypothetical protein [Sinisalibacter lacisalsi]GGD32479.1 hypothetical protein GCM10011358_15750 [Sinisalibacter lacisalsi]
MDYHELDPRGLIAEAYRIEGISAPECRAIFLDWALGRPEGQETAEMETLLAYYGSAAPDHPMSAVLREGLEGPASTAGRRGGARGRRSTPSRED